MDKKRKKIKNFSGVTILVVGDVALDGYVRGNVERMSPEAPAPVLLESSRKYELGCAANVARNVASLGAKVILAGVIGADVEGKLIRDMCKKSGIAMSFAIERGRPTTVKTRIMNGRNQLVRVDREVATPISKRAERELISKISNVRSLDFVIVSDYRKGVLKKKLMGAIRKKWGGGKIIADFKPAHSGFVRNVFAITPNIKETFEMTGLRANKPSNARKAAKLLGARHGSSVVLKRGGRGITVYEKSSGRFAHIPPRLVEVSDVTGAGDTVIAALALMCAIGSDLIEAAEFANSAAGIVVGKQGTATVTAQEIEQFKNGR